MGSVDVGVTAAVVESGVSNWVGEGDGVAGKGTAVGVIALGAVVVDSRLIEEVEDGVSPEIGIDVPPIMGDPTSIDPIE